VRPASGSLGLAYTSFVIRMLHGRDVLRGGTAAGLSATTLLELCAAFGASGAQVDLAQLGSAEPSLLAAVRAAAEERGLFLELSVPAAALADEAAFGRAAGVSRALGVSVWRVALVYGRRYEDFHGMEDWLAFTARWRAALPRAAGWLERADIEAGIENHKDLLAPEMADLLRAVGSPKLGACLDFGNNLALLEDPMDTVEILAPFAVTTHLKDMALRPCPGGFELSEVPLGAGLLPLKRMVEVVRGARPQVHFCLEMITRDPLSVPCRSEGYWVTYDGRVRRRLEAFAASALARAAPAPLPRIAGLTLEEMLAAEDANVRASVAYAKECLGL
jgi:sugar phosphate isomerase/epimerase